MFSVLKISAEAVSIVFSPVVTEGLNVVAVILTPLEFAFHPSRTDEASFVSSQPDSSTESRLKPLIM